MHNENQIRNMCDLKSGEITPIKDHDWDPMVCAHCVVQVDLNFKQELE